MDLEARYKQATMQLFSDLRAAVVAGQERPRSYSGTSKYKPESARFKMGVWYRDGNCRYYYSFDHRMGGNKEYYTDEFEGLKKLVRLAESTHVTNIKNIVIWCNPNVLPLTTEKSYNYEILKISSTRGFTENKHVSFAVDGPNILLNTTQLLRNCSFQM